MPVYVYHCDNCGIQFEKSQSLNDDPCKTSPACGKKTLHSVITAPVSVIYKGSGFYSTDHRSSSGATSAARSTKETTEKEPASEKPAEKTADSPKAKEKSEA